MILARGRLAAQHALPLRPFPPMSWNQQSFLPADAMNPFVVRKHSLALQHRGDPQMPEPMPFPAISRTFSRSSVSGGRRGRHRHAGRLIPISLHARRDSAHAAGPHAAVLPGAPQALPVF